MLVCFMAYKYFWTGSWADILPITVGWPIRQRKLLMQMVFAPSFHGFTLQMKYNNVFYSYFDSFFVFNTT